ncbi:conserved hypothetical protein [Streptomyces misionensis JCM 4497]
MVAEPYQVLVDASRGEGHLPRRGHVEQLRLQVADLHDDDVGRARVEVQVGEVVLVVVRLAQPGEDRVHAADADHDLGLGVAVAVPDGVHHAGEGDGTGVPVVHLGPGGDGDGGAHAGGDRGVDGGGAGHRGVQDGRSVVLLELRALQQPGQAPGDVTGAARGGVVAGVADEVGPVGRAQGLVEEAVEGPGRGDEVEVVAGLPEAPGEAFGAGRHRLPVGAGDHDGRAVAGSVGPGVADPYRRVGDPGHGLDLVDRRVHASGGLDAGGGLLSGQQHRDRHPRLHRAGGAGGEQVDQVAHRALLGLHVVLVRGHPVAGDQVAAVGEFTGDVAVQVHRGGDDHVGADGGADAFEQDGLGVLDALHAHRAVDVVPQAVEPGQGGEPVDEFVGERGPGGGGDHAARQRLAHQRTVPVGGLAQLLAGREEGVAVEHVGAPRGVEGGGLGAGRGERGRLDAESGDGDDRAGGGGSGFRHGSSWWCGASAGAGRAAGAGGAGPGAAEVAYGVGHALLQGELSGADDSGVRAQAGPFDGEVLGDQRVAALVQLAADRGDERFEGGEDAAEVDGVRVEEVDVGGEDLPEVLPGPADRAGGLGVGVDREAYDVLDAGDVGAAFPQDAHQGGTGGHGLQAAGLAAGAGDVGGAVDPDVGDVAGGAGRAPVEAAVDDDAGADRRAHLHHDRLPVFGGPHRVLAHRHAVGVVVDRARHAEAVRQPGGDREAVPPGHPRRQYDGSRFDVDGARQGQADGAQPVASALLGQRLQGFGEPGQCLLGAVGDDERDGGDLAQLTAGQHHADPGVPAAEVGGDGELVGAAEPQHLAGAPAGGRLGAFLGDQSALDQLPHGDGDGRGGGAEQSGQFGARRRLARGHEFQDPDGEGGSPFRGLAVPGTYFSHVRSNFRNSWCDADSTPAQRGREPFPGGHCREKSPGKSGQMLCFPVSEDPSESYVEPTET